jgi:hypothetical protein
MSRVFKLLFFVIVLLFSLACSLITNPLNNVQNTANTAQAIATDVSSLATLVPVETLGALPTQLSQIGDYFNPQGTPVAEWNGIPIMPQATAGQEFDAANYSYKYTGSPKEASEFYSDALGNVGWSPMVTTSDDQGGLLVYSKENAFLTITITLVEDGVVVWMSLS